LVGPVGFEPTTTRALAWSYEETIKPGSLPS